MSKPLGKVHGGMNYSTPNKGVGKIAGMGRRAVKKRMAKYAAMEREAERPPRVKRNGIEIN